MSGKSDQMLPNFSLGWELEATRRASKRVTGVECGHDVSVSGDGLEYRTKRDIVFDASKSLAALRALATDPSLTVDRSCGFHVHVGLGRRTRHLKTWAKWFVQLARDVEPEAFRAVSQTRRDNRYCRSWTESPGSLEAIKYSGNKFANRDRYNWVNAVEVFRPQGIRTIEVRLMGDTKRYSHLLAWTSTCLLMAQSSWALMWDPSRFEMERRKIKDTFANIRLRFIEPGARKPEAVHLALALANQARLIHPFGRPLESISQAEYYAQEGNRRSHLFEEQFEIMRRAYCTATRVPWTFAPGDTVECIRTPDDGGLTVGRFYRVRQVREDGPDTELNVLRASTSWWVQSDRVRLVERVGGVPCAV